MASETGISHLEAEQPSDIENLLELLLSDSSQTLKCDLGFSTVSSEFVERLCDALRQSKRRVVWFRTINCGLTSERVKCVLEALTSNRTLCSELEFFQMQSENLGAEGGLALAEAFPHLTSIKTMYFASDSLGDAGLEALLQGIPHLTQLEGLGLAMNGLGDKSAENLRQAFPHLKNLRDLFLQGNDFTDGESIKLLKAMAKELPLLQRYELNTVLSSYTINAAVGLPLQTQWTLEFFRHNPLHMASGSGDIEEIHALLESGIDPNAQDELLGETAVFLAARAGQDEAIRVLVHEGGASLRIRNKVGRLPIEVIDEKHPSTKALVEEMVETGQDQLEKVLIKSATKLN